MVNSSYYTSVEGRSADVFRAKKKNTPIVWPWGCPPYWNHTRRGNCHEQDFHAILPTNPIYFPILRSLHLILCRQAHLSSSRKKFVNCIDCTTYTKHFILLFGYLDKDGERYSTLYYMHPELRAYSYDRLHLSTMQAPLKSQCSTASMCSGTMYCAYTVSLTGRTFDSWNIVALRYSSSLHFESMNVVLLYMAWNDLLCPIEITSINLVFGHDSQSIDPIFFKLKYFRKQTATGSTHKRQLLAFTKVQSWKLKVSSLKQWKIRFQPWWYNLHRAKTCCTKSAPKRNIYSPYSNTAVMNQAIRSHCIDLNFLLTVLRSIFWKVCK